MFLCRSLISRSPAAHSVRLSWGPRSRALSGSSSLMQKYTFTSPNITVTDDKEKPKRKRHTPRTLESLSEEMKENGKAGKSSTLQAKSKGISKPKTPLNPIDAVNVGKVVPEGWRKENLPLWKKHKYAMIEKLGGEEWRPNKKLSRDQMASVRVLKSKLPELTAKELADHFKVSPEAIRRILKAKWEPKTEEEETEILERWKRRKETVKKIMTENRKKEPKKPIVIIGEGKQYKKVKTFKGLPEVKLNELHKESKKGNPKHRLYKADIKSLRKMEF